MRLAIIFATLFTVTLSHAETLSIAMPLYNPPFIMSINKAHYTGFDIDITDEICRRLSVQCHFIPMGYGELFASLSNGTVNLAIGAITITLERDKQYLFSLPYMQSYGEYIVKYNSNLHSMSDIPGKTIGIANASVYSNLLTNKYHDQITVKLYQFHADMLLALENGDVDALLLDKATAEYWYANSDKTYQQLGDPVQLGYGYGILANRGEDALIAKINTALLAMEADGTYLKIYNTYFSGGL